MVMRLGISGSCPLHVLRLIRKVNANASHSRLLGPSACFLCMDECCKLEKCHVPALLNW
jgi:hypothetical protein